MPSIIFRSYQNAVRTIFTGLLIFIVGRQRIKSVSTMQIKSNHQDVKQHHGIAVSEKIIYYYYLGDTYTCSKEQAFNIL